MRKTIARVGLGLVASLAFASVGLAQPSGGPDAKGNAPLKHAHTVNDGGAKRGATSFTEGQARQHIEKAGFSGVTHLARGDDGVWRGQAVRGGVSMNVAMDFKGNVSTVGSAAASTQSATPPSGAATFATSRTVSTGPSASPASAVPATARHAHRRHMARRHRRHHARSRHRGLHAACANPGPNGVACSGVDRNRNGVSDKEDRALGAGAKP